MHCDYVLLCTCPLSLKQILASFFQITRIEQKYDILMYHVDLQCTFISKEKQETKRNISLLFFACTAEENWR